MSDRFQELNCEHDVINLGGNNEKFFLEVPMFKLEELLQRIKLKLLHVSQQDWEKNPNENWIKNRKQWLYSNQESSVRKCCRKLCHCQNGKTRSLHRV